MIKSGIIESSDRVWASPLVPVAKPNGKARLCVDFRKLNLATPQKKQYNPCLDDILDNVGLSCVLSKLDLSMGFHQVVMGDTSRDLTTFVCPFGRFRFFSMPFGLKNAPAVFQNLIERVLANCYESFGSFKRGWTYGQTSEVPVGL